jgi:hypothetical protein
VRTPAINAEIYAGEGVRFFGRHTGVVLLDGPDQVVKGDRVLHLHYTVRRAAANVR